MLVTEGSSDEPLVAILGPLCIRYGAREAVVRWVDFGLLGLRPGHSVTGKVEAAVAAFPDVNLAFVHRDADGPSSRSRRVEIAEGVGEVIAHVPVVPVQETEAWLLASGEAAIRAAAGHPRGTERLALPRPRHVEARARPKELLEQVVERAQLGLSRRHRPSFVTVRRLLLERLDIDGSVREIPSFEQLCSDIASAVGELRSHAAGS